MRVEYAGQEGWSLIFLLQKKKMSYTSSKRDIEGEYLEQS